MTQAQRLRIERLQRVFALKGVTLGDITYEGENYGGPQSHTLDGITAALEALLDGTLRIVRPCPDVGA